MYASTSAGVRLCMYVACFIVI